MSVSNPPSSPQDTPIKDIAHRLVATGIGFERGESYGNQDLIERRVKEATQQLNQLITRSKIDELEKTINRMDVNKTDYADTYHYLHDRLTNLKESLNE